MLSLIVIEPEKPENLGNIARVMKNFDCEKLIIINPQCNHLDDAAWRPAKHARDVLKKAVVGDMKLLKGFDYLIATTASLGTDYNIPRSPISPKMLADILPLNGKLKIGLLIGREGIGLTNKEIELADFLVAIPTSKEYAALNVSHAVAILLYELYQKHGKKKIEKHIIYSSAIEKKQTLQLLDKVLDTMHFTLPTRRETQVTVWKRMLGKSFLTRREAYALMGFFKKILDKGKRYKQK